MVAIGEMILRANEIQMTHNALSLVTLTKALEVSEQSLALSTKKFPNS